MKAQIQKIVLFLVVIFLVASGWFSKFWNSITWIFTLHYSASDISFYGEIFVKMATFIISFGIVGFIFDIIGFHDKVLMHWSYYIISTLVSAVLCYIVMLLEKYLLWIILVFALIIAILFVLYIIFNKTNK